MGGSQSRPNAAIQQHQSRKRKWSDDDSASANGTTTKDHQKKFIHCLQNEEKNKSKNSKKALTAKEYEALPILIQEWQPGITTPIKSTVLWKKALAIFCYRKSQERKLQPLRIIHKAHKHSKNRRGVYSKISEGWYGISYNHIELYHKCAPFDDAKKRKMIYSQPTESIVAGTTAVSEGSTSDSSLFRFVDLGKGTSTKLKQLAESDNSNLSNMVVFNCNEEAYEKLSPSNKNNLSTLSTGVYTDTYRRQTIMMDTFNSHKEVTRVQDILQKKLKKDNILRRGSLLHTLPGGLRQQFHKDFDSCSKDKMFVIIPLQMNQYIYIKILGNKNVKLMLKNDHALVGNASLVHAGSEQRGKRLHFEFVPRDGVEVIEKNATYFEVDEEYPSRGECFKMSL